MTARRVATLTMAVVVAGTMAAGCSQTTGGPAAGPRHAASPGHAGTTSATSAAELRASVNALLAEHVVLAAAATGAALGGREAEFAAAAEALDGNSVDIARAIGSVYGADAERAFLPLWRRHIGFVVDYTTGVATQDRGKQEQAVASLVAYSRDLGAFLGAANPNLPKAVVADLVKHHVVTLKEVVDAQAGTDPRRTQQAVRAAYAHMQRIGDPLSAAIARQFPERFQGSSDSAASSLRTTLNLALREHVYLAAAATGAALGGREAEFAAAAEALDGNSVDIARAIGSVYGADAERAFLPLWRRHIGFVVDYTTGVATQDRGKQEQAVASLVAYSRDL
ncbi:MAG TPA: copper amine oxidase N-terminal domain-containing protein, partial [Candidatus Tectomicrobia bacterium]|nr:copper amine oxidase N-terminal domain-containing protein [Candidatus Tectomicrobia bacterium]